MKRDILDLYTILKRRKITIEEWLNYNNIDTLEKFNILSENIAGEIGCYITTEFKNDVFNFFSKKEEVIIKKNKKDKNNKSLSEKSINEEKNTEMTFKTDLDVVVSEVSNPIGINIKENNNES